jgi:hypothetical protein
MYKKLKYFKGWISVEKCDDSIENVRLNQRRVIELCNSHINKRYKISHKDGRVMYTNNITLTKLGKDYGSRDGFTRVMNGKRNSYKGWISVEVV